MASRASFTVLFGFYAVFCCLCLLLDESTTAKTGTTPRSGLAAAALVPAALIITLVLAALLAYAHVWALDRANAAGAGAGAGARFVARLAEATLLAAAVALLSVVAVRLGAAGEVLRLGGADDVGWLG